MPCTKAYKLDYGGKTRIVTNKKLGQKDLQKLFKNLKGGV